VFAQEAQQLSHGGTALGPGAGVAEQLSGRRGANLDVAASIHEQEAMPHGIEVADKRGGCQSVRLRRRTAGRLPEQVARGKVQTGRHGRQAPQQHSDRDPSVKYCPGVPSST
jgi:hypothetical protein